MEAIQYLSNEYIEKSLLLSVTERLEFLEEYRLLLPESLFEERRNRYIENWNATN
ncbi:MAG: hypothetical protein O9264_18900 [Leptospira sp.]|jgi:hypothetical protein|nr:hypothetical protein [Leptospira sp.]